MQDHWQVLQGDWHGNPIVVRLNLGAKSLMHDPRYNFRLGISVPFDHPVTNGLPAEDEEKELYRIEDQLADSLLADDESLFAAVVTTSGQREFAFYTRSPAEAMSKASEIRKSTHSHNMRIALQTDEEWRGFRQFLHE